MQRTTLKLEDCNFLDVFVLEEASNFSFWVYLDPIGGESGLPTIRGSISL